MAEVKKVWYKSKTKWAALVGAVGIAIPGIVSWLQGNPFPVSPIWEAVIVILGVFGVRDALDKFKK